MLKNAPTLVVFILLVFVSSGAGCRLVVEEDSYDPPVFSPFDASVDDSDASPLALCPEGTPDLFNNAYSPYFGGEESVDLEVVHFSSFNCPHCSDWAQMSREIWESRPDFQARVRMYFHHYILWDAQSEWDRHRATVAAHKQGMENFWKMHNLIYDGAYMDPPVSYSLEELTEYARNVLKLDMVKFEADLNSQETVSFLYWDKLQGYYADVTGTPSVFVCGEKILRSDVEEIVDAYLGNQ